MARVTLAFSVDSDKDADIVAWWGRLGNQGENRSAAMRAAIRAYRDVAGLTLGDLLNELGEIKRMVRNLQGGVIVQNGNGDDDGQYEELDPLAAEAQSALNGLGG